MQINKKINETRTERAKLEMELIELQKAFTSALERGQSYANQLLRGGEGTRDKKFKLFDLNELTSDDLSPYLKKLLGQRCTAIYNHQKGLRVRIVPTRRCR